MINANIIKDIVSALKESDKKPTSYDTTATVRRVEGNTAWVHIPGGVDETPVRMTIAAKQGDTVQVRVSGGSAFMVGNSTAPPTDDTTAKKVEQKVGIVERVVTAVKEVSESAAKIAGNTRQYFWFTSDPAIGDTGAHITEKPQDEFLADPQNGGGNLLARSNGIAVRDGTTELATFSESEINIGKNTELATIKFCDELVQVYTQRFTGGYTAEAVVCIDDTYNPSDRTTEYSSVVLLAKNRLGTSTTKEAAVKVTASSHSDETSVVIWADTVQLPDDVYNTIGMFFPQTNPTTWTAPTVVSNQATIRQGGYYSEGKRTYVQMEIRLASSLAEDTTLSEFLQGFPAPVNTLAVLSIATGGGGWGWAAVNTSGKMNIRLNKQTGTSTNIYITGCYTTA